MSTLAERTQAALDSIWMSPDGISQYPVKYCEQDGILKVSFDGSNFTEYPPEGWALVSPVQLAPTPITD